ncbi:hypothetical protein GCM10011402_29940 [Paracoccus acridae]|uniref:DUF488 domain-containing protein n=1 Tax=Paracoccus acridae TaxID=1795310 RepID=A0ABQ1VMB0_9RHOB|nr:DUF488 family protein [Paracoccus acridae]GGF75250.1 hypothetical protein GCM10011402_29940 [Paracoccus acridae]
MTTDVDIRIARDYDKGGQDDGARILVDRLWPRGLSKKDLDLDDWIKDIAPSAELRKWFDHDPEKWVGFQNRYWAELADNPEAIEQLMTWCRKGRVTLLYGAKDREHNQAVVLRDYLAQQLSGGADRR